jgi:hypothetical protein
MAGRESVKGGEVGVDEIRGEEKNEHGIVDLDC